MPITDPNVDLLKRVLDGAALRHKAIANNIANVDTPGYKRFEVVFQEKLQAALRDGGVRQAAKVQPRLLAKHGGTARPDGNNVDLEREMADLTKNSIMYDTVAQIVTAQLAAYREAIKSGNE